MTRRGTGDGKADGNGDGNGYGNGDGEGMLSRWSRRKRAARDGVAEAEPEAAPPEAQAAARAEPEPEKTDAEILEEHGLPDPDTIGPGDDIRGFMAKSVPARLRNRALRKLWVSNPMLANMDGLVDYGEDFTDAATVIENLTTAWQVGRGHARPEPAEPPADAPPEAASEHCDGTPRDDGEAPEAPDTTADRPEDTAGSDDPATPVAAETPAAGAGEWPGETDSRGPDDPPVARWEPDLHPPATRRKMAFRFD